MSRIDEVRRGWAGGLWLVIWAGVVAVALVMRPLLPIDETRYLSVAWEMWRRGDWLTPYLNGTPYSDKPPLLFWCMLAGWRLFGVNEWWPRLLSPLFALVSVVLLAHLAQRLSPHRADAAELTVPLLSGLLWVTYSTVVLFDTLLTACVLVALVGMVEARLGRPRWGWQVFGWGVGLGALAKGPVILVHVLPVALAAPWWGQPFRPSSHTRWYLGLAGGLLLGAGIGLAWAFTAGSSAGPSYRTAILWDQSARRIVHASAHARPWWWYLPLLPVILFPWCWWPAFWQALTEVRRGPIQAPVRFSLACVLPGLLILSLISGKQVHYLMPLLPAFAILGGVACAHLTNQRQTVVLSVLPPIVLLAAHLVGERRLAQRYDLAPIAAFLKAAETDGRPIAYVGHYSGQFHFLGRLDQTFDEISPAQQTQWTADHPRGLVIRDGPRAVIAGTAFARLYGNGMIGIWAANPESR